MSTLVSIFLLVEHQVDPLVIVAFLYLQHTDQF
jgi:hypothetical protein